MVTESTVESSPVNYKNGIKHGHEETLVTDLTDVVGVHCSILRSPIFVLSEVSAKKTKQIVAKTKEGTFTITAASTPMPTAKHAFYFDIFCSMFAMNWNSSGTLHYRWSDVLKIAGKNPRSKNSLLAAIETVRRYMGTHTSWKNSFELSTEQSVDWAGGLILQSSVFNNDGDSNVKQIGRDKNKENWNWMRFHPQLVDALNPDKDPRTRLLLSSTFQLGLKQAEHIMYRYFYGHWDTQEVWKSLYKPHEGLLDIFKWSSHRSQFLPWLVKVLDGLKDRGLIDYYKINESKTAIGVKCFNINEINCSNTIELESSTPKKITKGVRKGATRKETVDSEKISSEKVLEEYYYRREKKLLDESKIDAIDGMLLVYRGKRLPIFVVKAIRSAL